MPSSYRPGSGVRGTGLLLLAAAVLLALVAHPLAAAEGRRQGRRASEDAAPQRASGGGARSAGGAQSAGRQQAPNHAAGTPAQRRPSPPLAIEAVQPRLSLEVISEMAEDDPYRVMYLMALEEFMNRAPQEGEDSYHAVAGIHGALSMYNGQRPGASGFCRHMQEAFGPWHRPYALLYEGGLRAACRSAAGRLSRADRRKAALGACEELRAPYWDVTRGVPGLLTQETVRVYDATGASLVDLKNPLTGFCYKLPASTIQGTKQPGYCLERNSNWAERVAGLPAMYKSMVAAFLGSGTWECTHLAVTGDPSRGCAGNLEQFHNSLHGSVGLDMATFGLAAWDPLFWLHHINVDRLLFLFQSTVPTYPSNGSFTPFHSNLSCGANIGACGYSYGMPAAPAAAGGLGPHTSATDADAAAADGTDSAVRRALRRAGSTGGGDAAAPEAREYLRRYMAELTGGYEGYSWSLVLGGLNPSALGNRTFELHALLEPRSPPGSAEEAAAGGGAGGEAAVDVGELMRRPGYCGGWTGFSMLLPGMTYKDMTVAVPLDHCMERQGVSRDVPPADAARRRRGPARAPLQRRMLQLVCVDSRGRSCGADVEHKLGLQVSLGWSFMDEELTPGTQMFWGGGGGGDASVVAAAAAARPLGVPGRDGRLQYLYAQSMPLL